MPLFEAKKWNLQTTEEAPDKMRADSDDGISSAAGILYCMESANSGDSTALIGQDFAISLSVYIMNKVGGETLPFSGMSLQTNTYAAYLPSSRSSSTQIVIFIQYDEYGYGYYSNLESLGSGVFACESSALSYHPDVCTDAVTVDMPCPPTFAPTLAPAAAPSEMPSSYPSITPTTTPSEMPSSSPSITPTATPSEASTLAGIPTSTPIYRAPTRNPAPGIWGSSLLTRSADSDAYKTNLIYVLAILGSLVLLRVAFCRFFNTHKTADRYQTAQGDLEESLLSKKLTDNHSSMYHHNNTDRSALHPAAKQTWSL